VLVSATAKSSTTALVLSIVVICCGTGGAWWLQHRLEVSERAHEARRTRPLAPFVSCRQRHTRARTLAPAYPLAPRRALAQHAAARSSMRSRGTRACRYAAVRHARCR
jgi:hypothetical protein